MTPDGALTFKAQMQRILPEREEAFVAAGWEVIYRGIGLGGWPELIVFRKLPRERRKNTPGDRPGGPVFDSG